MYSVENNVFLNLKLHKHIGLHQIHNLFFFLATSYDPFKTIRLRLVLYCLFSIYMSLCMEEREVLKLCTV